MPSPALSQPKPLAGFVVECIGGALPVRLAAERLAQLGARITSRVTALDGACCGLLTARHPDFAIPVECEIAWGTWDGQPATSDVLIQAVTGVMQVHGRREGRVRRLGIPLPSIVCSVLAVQATLAGIFARMRGDDRPFTARTSIVEGACSAMGHYMAAAASEEGVQFTRQQAVSPPPFTSADGIRYEMEFLDPEAWKRFWSALGADARAVGDGWRAFAFRYAHAYAPVPLSLHHLLGDLSFDATARQVRAHGGSICALDARSDVCLDVRADTPPWVFDHASGARGAAERIAAGTDAPLSGIRVVESTRRIQGPLASRLLRQLGASVTRVEPEGGDPLRLMPPFSRGVSARFGWFNHAKSVVEIDLTAPGGRERVLQLCRDADVFIHNWAPGKAAKFGLTPADLAQQRSLVYALGAGWSSHPEPDAPIGTDFMVQAAAGLAGLVRPDEAEAAPSLMTILDVLGGCILAEGVLGALIQRQRTGSAVAVESSLLSAARTVKRAVSMTGELHGSPRWSLYQPVQCSDGFIQIDGADADTVLTSLAHALNITDSGLSIEDLERCIRARCGQLSCTVLSAKLTCVQIAHARVADDVRRVASLYAALHPEHSDGLMSNSPWRVVHGEDSRGLR